MSESLGSKAADVIAKFGGSWKFIFSLAGFLGIWMSLQEILGPDAWDHYPYVLLNLILSSMAAFQAPIIMMSQNRQEARDRAKDEAYRAEQAKTDKHLLTIGEAQLAHMESQIKVNSDFTARLKRIEAAVKS